MQKKREQSHVFIAVNNAEERSVQSDTLEGLVLAMEDYDMDVEDATYYYAQPIEIEVKKVMTLKTVLEPM